VGGLIGWKDEPAPAADPAAVRALFADLGLEVGEDPGDLAAAVRHFQDRTGITPDGVAGPRTVHLLARYAVEARELRTVTSATIDLAA
jgi:hypothetical protein